MGSDSGIMNIQEYLEKGKCRRKEFIANMKHCKYDKKAGTIDIIKNDKTIYWIPLYNLTDSAKILDFIFQVLHKNWCTEKIIFELLHCFDIACEDRFNHTIQGAFCSFGMNFKVDWKKRISEFKKH